MGLRRRSDLAWADLRGQANEIAPFVTTSVVATHEHWLATGRARAGWTTPQNVLLYATGGFAVAGVEAIIMPLGASFTETNTRWGWTAGLGGDAMLARGWSAKAEYLYVNLQRSSYFTPPPAAGINTRGDVPVDQHLVRFGLNYHFGAR